jgi:membrane protein implicated in regulation of membrane protease activity
MALRNWLRGVFLGFTRSQQDSSQNLQDFVGEKVVVQQAINPNQPGMVELHGTNWKARADVAISVGTIVEIVGNDNLTLVVKPAK